MNSCGCEYQWWNDFGYSCFLDGEQLEVQSDARKNHTSPLCIRMRLSRPPSGETWSGDGRPLGAALNMTGHVALKRSRRFCARGSSRNQEKSRGLYFIRTTKQHRKKFQDADVQCTPTMPTPPPAVHPRPSIPYLHRHFFFFPFFFFVPPPAVPPAVGVEVEGGTLATPPSSFTDVPGPGETDMGRGVGGDSGGGGGGRELTIFSMRDRFRASKRLRKTEEWVLNLRHYFAKNGIERHTIIR